MTKQKKLKVSPWIIVMYFYVILVLLTLFTAASYTWFTLSRTPVVSDMALYINTPTGMQITDDPFAEEPEWGLRIDFAQLLGETCPLRPITWSDQMRQFYTVSFGIDGRITDARQALTDERNANKNNADGYYIKGTFYARSDTPVDVSLSPAVEVADGIQGSGTYLIGTPVWDGQQIIHNNGGMGAQYAIRIGFLIQKTDLEGNIRQEAPTFFIYEPNADRMADGSEGYIPTPSIDGTPGLVPDDRLVRQTESTWTEAYPVQRGVVMHTLGTFLEERVLFHLDTDEYARISVYVWLEGQDVDCTNAIGYEAQILASIQFAADAGSQSGIVKIE